MKHHTDQLRDKIAPCLFYVGSLLNRVRLITVILLELEWVLRGFYDQARIDILCVFDHLMALPMVRAEDESVVTLAIDAYRAGLDFADALHHAYAHACERFLTFDDRGFARPAGRLKLKLVVMLPAR